MLTWITLIVLSALAGAFCAAFFTGMRGVVMSGAVPWLGLLAWQLYNEYFAPYRGGGASMWIIGQIFAGTIAAAVGIVAYLVCRSFINRLGR